MLPVKAKSNPKVIEQQKPNSKEPPNQRQKRVFGTNRCTNTVLKTAPEKSKANTSTGVSKKQEKSIKENPSISGAGIQATKTDKAKLKKKKSVSFQEQAKPNILSSKENEAMPQTPVRSPSLAKPKISGTPYYSAETKCRFDRLETSSYWLGQIKLAESVGKHFVSVAFFRLALETKAEPIRTLKIELKRYLGRHGHLSAETEWRKISLLYGIRLKDKHTNERGTNTDERETACSIEGKDWDKEETDGSIINKENEELKEEVVEIKGESAEETCG